MMVQLCRFHWVVAVILLLGGLPVAAGAESPLTSLLKAYDDAMRDGSVANTVTIEQELIRLANAKDVAALAPPLQHQRFGPAVLWALREGEAQACAPNAVKAISTYDHGAKLVCLPFLARFRSKAFVPWLREFQEALSADERRQLASVLRGARIASSSKDALDEALGLLKSSDASERLEGARSIGQARDLELCRKHLGALLESQKLLNMPMTSYFEDFSKAQSGQKKGQPIKLKTERDLALEAFNLAVWKPIPQWLTAVYMERGPLTKAPLGFDAKAIEGVKAPIGH